jgi:outer membrane protein OmpA-like peptidoglycan-associated protein
LAVVVAALLPAMVATAADEKKDHPLLTRYPGSEIQKLESEDFAKYKLVVAIENGKELTGRELEGKLTRLVYANPSGRSTLEIYRNYREALEKAGAKVLFSCEMESCLPAYARSQWSRYNGLFTAADGDPRYLAAQLAAKGGEAYVAVMVGKKRSQVDVLEMQAMDTGLVVVDPKALGSGIDRDGRVSVYGIYFDTDKATIKPESKAALDAIAELLRGRPTLAVYVVGHTDTDGSLAHNMDLSRNRARAVADALVAEYKIDRKRLEGHGVGPLAPAAPNTSDQGKAKNRRVELVAR